MPEASGFGLSALQRFLGSERSRSPSRRGDRSIVKTPDSAAWVHRFVRFRLSIERHPPRGLDRSPSLPCHSTAIAHQSWHVRSLFRFLPAIGSQHGALSIPNRRPTSRAPRREVRLAEEALSKGGALNSFESLQLDPQRISLAPRS
jgi:hypothetical protein